jgi:hypothetical protein
MRTFLARALALLGAIVLSAPLPAAAAGTWVVTLTAPATVTAACPLTFPVSGTIVDQTPYVPSVTYNLNFFPDPAAAGGRVQQGPQILATFAPDHTFAFQTIRTVSVSGHYPTQVAAYGNAGTVDSPTVQTTVTCTNSPRPAAWPDYQPYGGVRVGNQTAQWGSSMTLTDADRIAGQVCTFNIDFWVKNAGAASMASSLPIVLAVDGTTVGTPSVRAPSPLDQAMPVRTTVQLPLGAHVLTLDINKPSVVTVSNPADGHAQLNYNSTGKVCSAR